MACREGHLSPLKEGPTSHESVLHEVTPSRSSQHW